MWYLRRPLPDRRPRSLPSRPLLDLLAKTQGLEVIARTSSFYFKGKQVAIAEIANTLHVAHLLEGSVKLFPRRGCSD